MTDATAPDDIAPAPLDGYIRVSRVLGREGPSYISPDVQRDAIQRWADYRGVTIVEWHVDEDQSGGTQDRPGLKAAMRRIEARETSGLVCWRLNRFARNVSGAIEDVKRVRTADARLVFVEENLDCGSGSPFGDFMLTMLLAVATLERDNLVSSWDTAKERAIRRGAKIGPTPFGYERQADGRLRPHPTQAQVVTRLYELAASSGSHAAMGHAIEHAPDRTWTTSTLRRFLANRAYLGEARYAELVEPGAHKALVDVAVWTAAQMEPGARRNAAASFPLSGFAECATCGEGLVGGRSGRRDKPPVRMYRCRGSLTRWKGVRCPKPATIMADALEDFTRAQLEVLLADLRLRVGEPEADLAPYELALAHATAELDAFASDLPLRRALGASYTMHRDERVKAVDDARVAYARAAESSMSKVIAASELDAGGDLDGLAHAVLDSIIVLPGRGRLPGRVALVPL